MVRIPGPSALPPSIVFPTSVWHRIVAERRKKLLEIASHELKEGGKKENSVSPTTSPSRGAVLTMSQPKHKATYSHTTSLPTPPPTSPSLQNSLITASHRLSPPPPRHLRGPSLGQKEATKVGQREVFSFSRKHNHDTGLEVPSASDGWAAPPPTHAAHASSSSSELVLGRHAARENQHGTSALMFSTRRPPPPAYQRQSSGGGRGGRGGGGRRGGRVNAGGGSEGEGVRAEEGVTVERAAEGGEKRGGAQDDRMVDGYYGGGGWRGGGKGGREEVGVGAAQHRRSLSQLGDASEEAQV
jgi:hypothetical protein